MTLTDLTRLARELETSDPYDPGVQKSNLDRLHAVREEVRRGGAPELSACLGSVAGLIEALIGTRETISRDEIKSIACRMLYALGNDLGEIRLPRRRVPPSAPPQAERRAEAPANPVESIQLDLGPATGAAPAARPAPQPADPAARPAPPAPKPREEPAPTPRQPKRPDMVFGHILIELGQVTRKQVAAALRFHRAKGPRIGECLLLHGAITPELLLNALKIQEFLRTTPQGITPEALARYKEVDRPDTSRNASRTASRPSGPPEVVQKITQEMFLGEVLLGASMITNEQLEKALHLHYHSGLKVGEALVRLGVLTEDDVEAGLQLQKQLQSIAGTIS